MSDKLQLVADLNELCLKANALVGLVSDKLKLIGH